MYKCIHFCLYKHFDLIALFTLAINNHFNVYFHTHLLNEIKRRHFLWTNFPSTSPLMLFLLLLLSCKKRSEMLKSAGDKLQLTSFMALRLFCFCHCCLLLLFVVSCYCSLTHTNTHTHWLSGSSITGKRNKLNNFNFFALLLLSLSPPQLGAPLSLLLY